MLPGLKEPTNKEGINKMINGRYDQDGIQTKPHVQDKIPDYEIYPDIILQYKIPQDIIPESEEGQNPT